MRRAARGVASALVGALALAGCAPDALDVDWRLHFASASDAARAEAVEVCIVEGPCPVAPIRCDDGALVRYRETFVHAEDLVAPDGAMRPPRLPPGRYAFVARARDAACGVIATGCVELELPQPSARVTLETEGTASADCCGASCVDGMCQTGDAGVACMDDGNPCTASACDARGACIDIPIDEGRECAEGAVGGCDHSVCIAGACVPAPRTGAEGMSCAGPDRNPCLASVCRGMVCAEIVALDDGTVCGDDERHRCCGATCVNIYTNPEHCGGCGLACAPGFDCHNTGGPRLTACDCAMGVDCPNGTMHSDCAGATGGTVGHCVCRTRMGCAADQSCDDTSRGRSCAYP